MQVKGYFFSWGLMLLIVFSSFRAGNTPPEAHDTPAATLTSVQDGNWSDPDTWDLNTVPDASDIVVMNHEVTLNSAVTRNSGTSTTVGTSGTLILGATLTNNGATTINGTCQMNPGGWATGNDFTYGTGGNLIFNTDYNIDANQSYWPVASGPHNVIINSGFIVQMNDGSRTVDGSLILNGGFENYDGVQVNGNLQINTGGYVDENSPTYGSASTLIYNSGGTYDNRLEWTAATTPHNVLLQNNTILNYPTEVGNRHISGDLTIEGGAAFDMDHNGVTCEGVLTVDGNVNVFGNLSLGEEIGDDLKIGGHLNLNTGYSLYPNDRAIFFIGTSGTQMITTPSSADLTLDYLMIGEGGNTTVQHNQDLTITGQLTISASAMLTSNAAHPGGYQITIQDGPHASDFDIYGTYILFGNAPVFESNATCTVFGSGLVRADDDVGDDDSEEFASSNAVHFLTDAIFEWNNPLSFEGSNTTYFPNSTADEIPVFKISQPTESYGTIVFNGVVAVDANLDLGSGGTEKTFRNGITGSAILSQDFDASGHFVIDGQNAILGGSGLTIRLSPQADFDFLSSVNIPKDSSVLILGNNIDNHESGNTLTVNGTLDMDGNEIDNAGEQIIISGTGLYRTAHPGGFSGSGSSIPSNTSTEILQAGSTVELYALGNQDIISRTDFSNIIFSGSGTKTPSSGFGFNGTITIKDDAILDCTGHNVGGSDASLVMEDNSRLIVSTTGTQPHMGGAYTLSGGTIVFAGNNTLRENIRSRADIIYNIVEVKGNNVGNSTGNIALGTNGVFHIYPGAVFTINSKSIESTDGTASVILDDGAILNCGTNQGFNGFPSDFGNSSAIDANITNITLNPGSTIIYMGNSPQPITNADGLIYQNLILDGAYDRIAPANALEVQGNFTLSNAAHFVHNDGEVIFSGTGTQNITVNTGAIYPEFYDLTNQNKTNLKINSDIGVVNVLTLGNASKIDLAADITLRSGNGFTAAMAPIPVDAEIKYGTEGRFKVERYIPHHSKAWQLLSIPTKGSTINESWQNGDASGVASEAGQGVNIPGEFDDWEDRGFDGQSNTPGMKTYDPGTGQYIGVQRTSDPIENIHGYFLFVRGDRYTQYPESATATTLHTRGKLYARTPAGEAPQDITVPAGGFQMVGNPYPSAINFADIGKTNVDASYYVWDPNLTGGYGVGGYRTISIDGTVVPEGGAYIEGNIPPIQSGQAFFVSNIGGTDGTVSFEEADKTTGSVAVFRTSKREMATAKLRVHLYALYSQPVLVDGALSLFGKDFEKEIDRWDARKLDQSGAQISILTHQRPLAIERTLLPKIQDTLFYQTKKLRVGNYLLKFITDNMDARGLTPFLGDHFTKSIKELAPDDTTAIPFTVTDEAASGAVNRFFIFFKEAQGPLPLKFINISATADAQNNIDVKWKCNTSATIDSFLVETAVDGIHFKVLTGLPASSGNKTFHWLHQQPGEGIHYYRVIAMGKSSNKVYSDIVNATISPTNKGIRVFPNPVRDGKVQIRFSGQVAGKYLLTLMAPDGAMIQNRSINHQGGTAHYTMHLSAHLADGNYLLRIWKPGGTVEDILLMKGE